MSVKVYLQSGPCQGETKTLTNAQFASGQTTCKGALYKDTGGFIGRPPIHLFAYDASGGGGGGGGGSKSIRAHSGWADLRQSINHNMPRALNKSNRNVRAALRSLSRGRKVRA